MKKVWGQGLLVMLITLLINGFVPNTSNAQGSVSLQVFYDELQPYGTWTQHARFGYVWMPNVDRGFTPYSTNGYWINTEYGNTWVSDYSWGWAPFHYGRWFYDDFSGWIWVPDTEWAPAWVAWRSGGGYYGWAPLMPGFGVSMSYNYYNTIPHRYWNFVPSRYITYRTVHHHCIPRTQVVNIINHTTVITHNYTDNHRRTYFTGPSRSDMERTGRTRVDVYRIEEKSRPGRTDIDRGTASFYKPEINNSRDVRSHAEPSRYTRENGSGRMEQVESKGRQQEFDRERNEDRNTETQRNAVREDYRTNNITPEIESNSNRTRNLETQRNAVREDYRTNNATPERDLNSNRPKTRDAWQKEFHQPNQPNRWEGSGSDNKQDNLSSDPNRESIRREQFQRQQPTRDRGQTDQNLRREPAQQSQRMQFDRQTERNPSGRESQNFQQRSSTQNFSRENMPARNGEVQRSTGGSRSNQPATRSSGLSHDNRSKHRD